VPVIKQLFRTTHKNANNLTAQEGIFIGPRDTPAGNDRLLQRQPNGIPHIVPRSFDWLFQLSAVVGLKALILGSPFIELLKT